MAENTAGKQRGKPFKPGQSGNPAGKPKGAKNKATVLAQALFEGEAEILIRKIIELAKNGDMQTLKICIDRLCPPIKAQAAPVRVEIPETESIRDLAEAFIKAAANGLLPIGKVCQRQVLYLGEINDSQKARWSKAIDVVDGRHDQPTQLALFPDDREAPELACKTVNLRLSDLSLHRPRQWGSCWLSCQLWDRLQLDQFRTEKLSSGRKGGNWLSVLKTFVCYRPIHPSQHSRNPNDGLLYQNAKF